VVVLLLLGLALSFVIKLLHVLVPQDSADRRLILLELCVAVAQDSRPPIQAMIRGKTPPHEQACWPRQAVRWREAQATR
jgi:hypothetical protein